MAGNSEGRGISGWEKVGEKKAGNSGGDFFQTGKWNTQISAKAVRFTCVPHPIKVTSFPGTIMSALPNHFKKSAFKKELKDRFTKSLCDKL